MTPSLTGRAVRSYRTISPLPRRWSLRNGERTRQAGPTRVLRSQGGPRPDPKKRGGVAEAVSFLWHWPSVSLEAHVPDVIRHTALRSSDFPPPVDLDFSKTPGSDRPVLLPVVSLSQFVVSPVDGRPESNHVIAECAIIFLALWNQKGSASLAMNKAQQATLIDIFARPTRADIRWSAIESLIRALGGEVTERAGSRVAARLNGVTAVFHRPHPRPETKRGAVDAVRQFLTNAGVKP